MSSDDTPILKKKLFGHPTWEIHANYHYFINWSIIFYHLSINLSLMFHSFSRLLSIFLHEFRSHPGDGVDDGVDDDLDDLDAEPGAEMLGDGDVGVLEDEGLEGAVHVATLYRSTLW